MMLRGWPLLLLLFGGAASARPSSAPTRIEWKFTKNDVIRYRVSQQSSQVSRANEVDQKTSVDTAFLLEFTIQDVLPDGTARVEGRYEAARCTLEVPGLSKIQFDSTKPLTASALGDPYVRMLGTVVGRKFQLHVTKKGGVPVLGGATKIAEDMLSQLAGLPIQKSMRTPLMETFGDEAMKRTLSSFFAVVPGVDVRTGDGWKSSIDLPVPQLGTITFENQYQFNSCENVSGDGSARIPIQITATMKFAPSPEMAAQYQFEPMGGGGTGNLLFNYARGRTHRMSTETYFKIKSDPRIPEGVPRNMTPIETTVRATTTFQWVAPGEKL